MMQSQVASTLFDALINRVFKLKVSSFGDFFYDINRAIDSLLKKFLVLLPRKLDRNTTMPFGLLGFLT